MEFLRSAKISINRSTGEEIPLRKISAHEALRSPALAYEDYPIYIEAIAKFGLDIFQRLANDIRYDGYIRRQDRRVERFKSLEEFEIPCGFEYSGLKGLKIEAREKLSAFKPETLGQASRISGVSPGDITVLMVYLQRI